MADGIPKQEVLDELLLDIEGLIGLSSSFPQSRYGLEPSYENAEHYKNLYGHLYWGLKTLRESGFVFVNPNPHQDLREMWAWCWTFEGGAQQRMLRPRELYAVLISKLKALREATSHGADSHAEIARELRESAHRTNELFVIMAFHPETDKYWEEAIAPAAFQAGLQPIRIDKVETEMAVSEEILSSIRRALLVLCDLSFERPNCYFEAGFAKGSFRRVIFTAREDHDPRSAGTKEYKVHFDVDQLKITWWNPAELVKAKELLSGRLAKLLDETKFAECW